MGSLGSVLNILKLVVVESARQTAVGGIGQREHAEQFLAIGVDPVRRYFIAREGKACRRVFDHNQLPIGIQALREIALALQGGGHVILQNRWRGIKGKAGRQVTLGDFRVPKEEQLAPVGVELAGM